MATTMQGCYAIRQASIRVQTGARQWRCQAGSRPVTHGVKLPVARARQVVVTRAGEGRTVRKEVHDTIRYIVQNV
eukprot:801907-Pyramimonas_sp.AAC.1